AARAERTVGAADARKYRRLVVYMRSSVLPSRRRIPKRVQFRRAATVTERFHRLHRSLTVTALNGLLRITVCWNFAKNARSSETETGATFRRRDFDVIALGDEL